MSGNSFTEFGILWEGKKATATGVVTCAAPITLDPKAGLSLVIQEIAYENGRPDKAPKWKISVVSNNEAKNDDSGKDNSTGF